MDYEKLCEIITALEKRIGKDLILSSSEVRKQFNLEKDEFYFIYTYAGF